MRSGTIIRWSRTAIIWTSFMRDAFTITTATTVMIMGRCRSSQSDALPGRDVGSLYRSGDAGPRFCDAQLRCWLECREPRRSGYEEIMIRKLPSGKYRLYSGRPDPRTGKRRNLGTFATLEQAKKHERAVQFFKRHR